MTEHKRNFDDDSYDEVEESFRDHAPGQEDLAYFPLEESKPPHY
ncbi:hypothetical protein [Prochlorococcus sp. MIT 1300]|nr:hypothetical protein [Prochlorococcus sp. MIT 1300]